LPCLLKRRTADSPGIISFTIYEALWGVATAPDVERFLVESADSGAWVAGVHVQGNLGWMQEWPAKKWHAFVLWPDTSSGFVATVPDGLLIALNCVNMLPDDTAGATESRLWDVCIVSRPVAIKRAAESLRVLRALLELDPSLTTVVVAPDIRKFGGRKQPKGLVDEFYEASGLFTASELRNISFLCTSEDAFGRFPIGQTLYTEIMRRSRFMFLYSHSEGTPRVLGEALLHGTPCIVSESLQSGINQHLTSANTLRVSDEPAVAAAQIADALAEYDSYTVDVEAARQTFGASANVPRFQGHLRDLLAGRGLPDDGEWYLGDLHLRLACHGQKYNSQFKDGDSKIFFKWLERVESLDPNDEDAVLGPLLGAGS
jgi:hypothetical protein